MFTETTTGVPMPQLDIHCCLGIEYMMVQCRPFYLPRELRSVLITTVCVPPQANAEVVTPIITICFERLVSH